MNIKSLFSRIVANITHTSASTPAPVTSHPPADTIEVPRGEGLAQNLTLAHVKALVRELAPLVQTHPGYRQVNPEHLQVEVVDTPTLFKRIASDCAHSSGVTDQDAADKLSDALQVAPMGLYIWSTKTLSVSTDRAARMSWDTLRSMVFHEMIHWRQHETYPAFRAQVDAQARVRARLNAGDPEVKTISQALKCRMTLIEGEAVFWQNKLRPTHFPAYRDLDAGRVQAAAEASKAASDKMDQYLNGYVFFEQIEKKQVPYAFVEAAFEQPALADKYLVDFSSIFSLPRSKDRRKKPSTRTPRKVSSLLFEPSKLML